MLERFNAGAVIYDDDTDAFSKAIVSIVSDDVRYDAMQRGAARFVDEHQWARTLEPLRAFCRAPRFERTKDAFAAPVHIPSRPVSILDRLKRKLRA